MKSSTSPEIDSFWSETCFLFHLIKDMRAFLTVSRWILCFDWSSPEVTGAMRRIELGSCFRRRRGRVMVGFTTYQLFDVFFKGKRCYIVKDNNTLEQWNEKTSTYNLNISPLHSNPKSKLNFSIKFDVKFLQFNIIFHITLMLMNWLF